MRLAFLIFLILMTACDGWGSKPKNSRFEAPHYLSPANTKAQIKILSIPEFPQAYNAGILKDGDKYLLAYRISEKTSGFGFSILDEDFNIQSTQKIDCYDPRIQYQAPCEDPRLIKFRSKVYVVYNNMKRMQIAELERSSKGYLLKNPKQLSFGNSRIEKNWSPFIYNDELYFIYRTTPKYTVLKVTDPVSFKLEELDVHPFSKNPWQGTFPNITRDVTNGPDLRGSTPAIQDPYFDNYYLTVFHSLTLHKSGSKEKYVYLFGAYYFSPEEDFKIKHISKSPIIIKDLYNETAHKIVVFPQGILLDDETVTISAGLNDEKIVLITIPRTDLYLNLVPAEEG